MIINEINEIVGIDKEIILKILFISGLFSSCFSILIGKDSHISFMEVVLLGLIGFFSFPLVLILILIVFSGIRWVIS